MRSRERGKGLCGLNCVNDSRIDTQFICVVSDQMAVDEPGVDAGVIGHKAGHSAAH